MVSFLLKVYSSVNIPAILSAPTLMTPFWDPSYFNLQYIHFLIDGVSLPLNNFPVHTAQSTGEREHVLTIHLTNLGLASSTEAHQSFI